MENLETDSVTGHKKRVHIEYFLKGESLGKTLLTEFSFAERRISEAKAIGISYYDGFILDNGRLDSRTILLKYNGESLPMDDFNKCDDNELKTA